MINVDKLTPNFNTDYNFEPDIWPSRDIFHFRKWRSNETYMKVVKNTENHDNGLRP